MGVLEVLLVVVASLPTRTSRTGRTGPDSSYLGAVELRARYQQLAARYPHQVQLERIGRSQEVGH